MSAIDYSLALRSGELVTVRTPIEIHRTLDERGALDELPFMPEMLQYCGRTLRVAQRADKTCAGDGAPWHMQDAVHLESVRCDGSAHGGCQAACLMYWKEAWLERAEHGAEAESVPSSADGDELATSMLVPATVDATQSTPDETVYRCQATQIPRAASRLRAREVSQYFRDVRNWNTWKIIRGLSIRVFNHALGLCRRVVPPLRAIGGGQDFPYIVGKLPKGQTPKASLGLQPGDLVRIKSKKEIARTLDLNNHNRGLRFDNEMLKYCGRTARVQSKVERLIDERTGRMINIKSDCIILEGVVCDADYHLFCTRKIYAYWREVWLERVEVGAASGPMSNGSCPALEGDRPVERCSPTGVAALRSAKQP